jgi:outer membrane cobalamin receptor
MVRVPRHSWSTTLIHTNKNLTNKINIIFSDEVRDYGNANNSFKDVMLDEYLLLSYNLNYKVYDNLNFYLNFDNILDENYEKAYMYSSMKRSFNLGLSKSF